MATYDATFDVIVKEKSLGLELQFRQVKQSVNGVWVLNYREYF